MAEDEKTIFLTKGTAGTFLLILANKLNPHAKLVATGEKGSSTNMEKYRWVARRAK